MTALKYTSEQPCVRARHLERYVSDNSCVECKRQDAVLRNSIKRTALGPPYEALRSPEKTAAKVAGLPTYFTRIPCKHGHLSARYVANGSCIECHRNIRKKPGYATAYSKYNAKMRVKRPLANQLNAAKTRARLKDLPFDITLLDLPIPDLCPCCGKHMVINIKTGTGASYDCPSIDRLRPHLGYVKGNVAVICWRCNNLKSDASAAELHAIATWMSGRGLE